MVASDDDEEAGDVYSQNDSSDDEDELAERTKERERCFLRKHINTESVLCFVFTSADFKCKIKVL